MNDCLEEDVVLDLIEGRLSGADIDQVTRHLDTCASCSEVVAQLAQSANVGEKSERAPLPRGANVGRYVVLDRLGSGAMGIVYAAFDPELDRRIALKLLRADVLAARTTPIAELRARLVKEAQALARLSHPNVIAVFDVGTYENEVFVATEYVAGGTLGEVLRARERSTSEILELFRQAGEGLAAAHEAGVIHRDFKPENALVGSDGRVRVSDFGLAHTSGTIAGEHSLVALGAIAPTTATRTGALVGTPAYMAPEQWRGGTIDARTDVFSFAVALYEALYKERPFAGETFRQLATAIERNEVRGANKATVSAGLRRSLLKALRCDPKERHASMRALLDELVPPERKRTNATLAWASAFLVAFVAIGVLALRKVPPPACADAPSAWGDVFNTAARDAVHRAFVATGDANAEHLFSRVAASLDAYRTSWTTMRTEACEATHVKHAQSEALLDVRMVCLSTRRDEARALVDLLEHANETTVKKAVDAASALTPVAECARVATLLSADPPPSDPQKRAEYDAVASELTRAKADLNMQQRDACQGRVAPLIPRAEALGHKPLLARTLLISGWCAAFRGHGVGPVHTKEIAEVLQRAATTALAGHQDDVAIDAWIQLINVAGFDNKVDEVHLWDHYAEAGIARLGGDDEREALRLIRLATQMFYHERKLPEADALALRARELFVKTLGPRGPYVAECDEIRANVLLDTYRYAESLPLQRAVRQMREELYGPGASLSSTLNEAVCLYSTGQNDEAIALFLDLAKRLPDQDGPFLRRQLAYARRNKGDFQGALADDQRALEMSISSQRPKADIGLVQIGLGEDWIGLNKPKEALPILEAAVTSGVLDDDLSEADFALAQALWISGGDRARALDLGHQAHKALEPMAKEFGGGVAKRLEEIDAWIGQHKG
jgi:hypothetical protein